MSELSYFLKKNKIPKPNVKYIATKSLCDENGKPLEWELKPISTKESEHIQNQCMLEVPITGKPHQYRTKVDTSKYITKLIVTSVVYPDLYNAELQDSYDVQTPDDLIKEMIDDAGEWNNLIQFVNEYNGFSPLQDDVEEAKN